MTELWNNSTHEDWELRFAVLDWLDANIETMRRLCYQKSETIQEQRERWRCYQALSEYREQVVENHERFDFGEHGGLPDMERMDEIRKRFEQRIGRPVRKREDITRLGFYAKQARARIQAERDAALGAARRRGTDEK